MDTHLLAWTQGLPCPRQLMGTFFFFCIPLNSLRLELLSLFCIHFFIVPIDLLTSWGLSDCPS